MSKTIAVHVRYNFLYISLPSSAKQQSGKTNFCAVYGTRTTTAIIFRISIWNCTLSLQVFKSHWRTEQIETFGNFACKTKFHFSLLVVLVA